MTIEYTTEDDTQTWYYGEEALENDDLIAALLALQADSFTDEQPTGQQEISLTVQLDNENISQVSLALYRHDGTSCLAVVDGKTVALVPRTDVVELIEAVHAIVLK